MTITQRVELPQQKTLYTAVYSDKARFDEGKTEVEQAGFQIPAGEQLAGLRVQERKGWPTDFWLYISLGYVCDNKTGKRYLTRNSPVMANSKRATNSHTKGIEFAITQKQLEKAKQGGFEITDKIAETGIPVAKLASDDLGVYVLGKNAELYGLLLAEKNIQVFPVMVDSRDYIKSQPSSFANQAALRRVVPGYRGGLRCYYRNLNYGVAVCGVKEVAGCVVSSHEVAKTAKNLASSTKLSQEDLEALRKLKEQGRLMNEQLESLARKYSL